MRKAIVAGAVVFLVFATAGAALEAPEEQKDFKTAVNPGFAGRMRPGCTFPVAVEVETFAGAMSGVITITAETGDTSLPVYTAGFEKISPGVTYRYLLYPYCTSGTDSFVLEIRDSTGRELEKQTLAMQEARTDLYLVGILDSRGIPGLAFRADSEEAVGVAAALVPAAYMPTKECGYAPADAIVWAHPDPSMLSSAQEGALADWVLGGGRLVIATGDAWEGAAKGFLAGLVPGKLLAVEETLALDELERYGGFPIDRQNPMVISALSEPTGEVVMRAGPRPLVVRKRVGFGEVIFLAFDPTKGAFARWRGAEKFWNGLFGLEKPKKVESANEGNYTGGGRYYQDTTVGSAITQALNDFPKVRPIPFAFVVFFLVTYVILIGPVDYFVLKKLKHLEWTWFTFPAVALAATLVAFWAITSSRTVQIYVNQFSIEDWSADGKAYRNWSFATLLSPKNEHYDVTFGQPGATLNLMQTDYGRGGGALTRGHFAMYDAPGGGMVAKEIHVPIWSSRTFAGRWSREEPPVSPIRAELSVDGGKLDGTIENTTDFDIGDVKVIHRSGLYNIGMLAAGERRDIAVMRYRSLDVFRKGVVVNNLGQYGQKRPRADVTRIGTAAGLLGDGRFHPVDFRATTPAEMSSVRGESTFLLDLPSELSILSLLEEGQALVTGFGDYVSAPLEMGFDYADRWDKTMVRVMVDVD